MQDETYVGAIDQGTTGTRFMVFDHAGQVVGDAYETHEQQYPAPGWVTHDPSEIWANTKQVVRGALADGDVDPDQLAALGVTNQRETTLVWDAETGDPLHDAIVWQDRRTTDRVEDLVEAGWADDIRATTGLQVDAYFSATKLEWLLDHADTHIGNDSTDTPEGSTDEPTAGSASDGDLRARAEAGEVLFGTIDSWLLYNLTGRHRTDVTNASRTMLFDIHEADWDDDLLELFSIPREMLPAVRPSSDPDAYGYTDPDGFLGARVPVTGVLGDQQAALFGQTCVAPGDVKNTYGTGSFVLMHTGSEAVASDHGLLTTIAFQRAGEPVRYALEGSIFVTGAAIQWLEDVGIVDDPDETAALAGAVASTDGVVFVPAFTGLGAPHWDQRARGTLLGLTRGTRREHVVRAALEAIAYQTRDVVEAMEADAGVDANRLRVDGGAVKNDVLCQLQADVLGRDVVRPAVDETTALGAAYAAGLAVGYWESEAELHDNRRVDRVFAHDPDADVDADYARWLDAVERAKGWARAE